MPMLVLFDIDGTLVLTGRAGIRAMNRAGEAILGVRDLLDGIPVAGRTDWIIFEDALARLGRTLDAPLFDRLRDAHVACLREEIAKPGEGPKAVMPGIPPLLDALAGRPGLHLGLLTGNFREAARIKLEHFDLWRYFPSGAFGDDAADRNALVPVAIGRAEAHGYRHAAAEQVVVIGDTPHDVACARASGARAVAVATGTYSVAALQETGADVVLPDLADTHAFLRWLEERV